VANVDLVFSAVPLTTGDLVFGDDGSSPISNAIIDGTITLARPTLVGHVALGIVASGALVLARPTLVGEVLYHSDTQRPLVGRTRVRFQDALAIEVGTRDRSQRASRLPVATVVRFQPAAPLRVGVRARWADTQRMRRASRDRFQDGAALGTSAVVRFQDSQRLPLARSVRFQDGDPLRVSASLRYQDGRKVRNQARTRYQDAIALHVAFAEHDGYGRPIEVGSRTRYQDAMRPPPGIGDTPIPPEPEPCYLPGGDLVFDALWSADTNLVFICERHGSQPGETVVIPVRRVYVVENHITLHRVDTGAAIEADAFNMSLDVDSWTWSWGASLPASALSLIEPGTNGDPVDIETTVNGVAFRLCAESYSRERSFGKARIRVQGRGRAAILDAPYAPVLNHFSALDRTAQQLALQALTINGVGIGWDLAWGLEDWSVPGGTWNFQGTYIAAVQDIVRAAGGYVQPHRTAATLRVLPRYPATPWTWDTLTPDFELPSAVTSVEGIEWQSLPPYDRVFVGGTRSDGVLGQVTRAGTAGGVVAPMVTHPLITNATAARQRGLAELSNTGRQALVTLRMPVLAETGIIQPGALVRYVDGPTTRLGLVRSTAVSWDRPVLRQTIGIETHVS
jgi:hypothetical protein